MAEALSLSGINELFQIAHEIKDSLADIADSLKVLAAKADFEMNPPVPPPLDLSDF